jgi:drug/metabolite transporter (DMT)-like permease
MRRMAAPTRTPASQRRDPVGGVIVGFAALLFGSVVVIGRSEPIQAMPVPTLLAVRFGIAAAALALVVVATRRSLRAAPGEGGRLFFLGAVLYALESALFFLALERGTAATVTLLFYTYPVLVALLSATTGGGLPGWVVGGSLMAAVAGTIIVVASSGGLDISVAGIGFALGSALTFSVYLVGADRLIRRTPPLATAMWVSLSASLGLAAAAVVTEVAALPATAARVPVAGMGVLTAGAFFFLFLGLRRVGAVRSSVIASLEPVAAAVLAAIFVDEPIRAGVFAGGVLILAGAIAATVARGVPRRETAMP